VALAEERESIIGVLEFTGKLLELLMSRLDLEDRELFQDAWYSETKPQLDEAIRMLRGQPREEDTRIRAYELYEAPGREHGHDTEDWESAGREISETLRAENGPFHSFLRRVGLAGKSLKLKLRYLAEAASGGWRGKLLSLLNKFLGSLAGGLPGVEPVKEPKEWLEGIFENKPELDPSVSSIYVQSGPDPFHMENL
jgi:DUF2934 family protein